MSGNSSLAVLDTPASFDAGKVAIRKSPRWLYPDGKLATTIELNEEYAACLEKALALSETADSGNPKNDRNSRLGRWP